MFDSETGWKLQLLMDACTPRDQASSARPVPQNATTSGSQQTISAQRQLLWQQSSQGNNKDPLFLLLPANKVEGTGWERLIRTRLIRSST